MPNFAFKRPHVMQIRHIILTALLVLAPAMLAAQEQEELSPEQQEKKFREGIDAQVERYENALDLEIWQTFYVDSILNHNYNAMKEEFKVLSDNKVANPELFIRIQDKWEETSYQAFRRVLNDEQWAKYCKMGASRAKKARDKREEKRNKTK